MINQDYRYSLESKSPGKFKLALHHALFVSGIIAGTAALLIIDPHEASATKPSLTQLEEKVQLHSLALPDSTLEIPDPRNQTIALLKPNSTLKTNKITDPISIETSPIGLDVKPSTPAQKKWKSVTIRSGDSLAAVFSRLGLSPTDLHQIMALGKKTKRLKKIFPGDVIKVNLDSKGQLDTLHYELDEAHLLAITQTSPGQFKATTTELPLDVQLAYAEGTINSSLFLAAQKAQLPDRITMELANIFGWDIDFALDIRKGDHFALLYEELYRDGKKLKNGKIVAATFTNNNSKYEAVYFRPDNGRAGYYSPDGLSMRKTFLRTPVEFARISSRFSTGRKHPVLNKIRAHKGVDYAAPKGTAIRATGDGKVVYRGRKGGYGKAVVIQHGSQYSTLYAHLSKYARSAKSGRKVKQGQIIGYVGSTGLATGPHLHYEFRVNGVHRNPLTVRFPSAKPLPKQYHAKLKQVSDTLLARLQQKQQTQLASNP